MKILKTDTKNFDKSIIGEAIEVMANGGVILYPTDTVYGLGANIFNRNAVKKIFQIKNRSPLKPLSILISSKKAIDIVAKVDVEDKKIIDKYLPGPYTFILNKTTVVPRTVTGGLTKVGVRVPDYNIACQLANLFPIITTSANLTNEETLNNPEDILKQLDVDVDLVIDVGELENNNPSTIVDLTSDKPVFTKR
ncbi:MAG: L-threonylcarbamoyladenylate synthase [Methanobrevibacter sp.]|uniref:L-threonylcarbamoyladenylate synthase n=1 Tax=Methanobrevibacter sp. TaxID=66852 RepID=UPI0026E0C3F2|nr:L-threonylcarbamoyladenylate synthase [Methanobrevibacter sp.]MDO5848429.1 L-threonylcarbamoyladenylate synthase [Methanobrevibacter sp.]